MAPSTTSEESAAAAAVREIHVNQDCAILQDSVDGVPGVRVPGATAANASVASGGEGTSADGAMQPGAGGQQGQAAGEMNAAVCHLESAVTSNNVRGDVVNGAVQRSVVVVKEQKYLLRDPFATPVVFVVEHAVPDGWVVNSDPKPTKMEGKVALFRVAAQQGQVVTLHVAAQHSIALAQ